ncbi:hypothetical protein AVEN_9619-1 [Araneus ventricosus]|uniref:Uncharacterized protein n=1 Tax=Araneus ventricosus TaxID=182803 RepID=A0A4Y2EYZ4_ARAVE|nr:hypothetical protein AVEN_9619-1 [Araneus ventricosus]
MHCVAIGALCEDAFNTLFYVDYSEKVKLGILEPIDKTSQSQNRDRLVPLSIFAAASMFAVDRSSLRGWDQLSGAVKFVADMAAQIIKLNGRSGNSSP